MFIIQFMKLLVIAAFVYMVFSLVRFFIRTGAALNEKRFEDRERQARNARREGMHVRGGKDVIELDKDQYHVD